MLDFLNSDYKCSLYDNIIYYKTVIDKLSIPQITEGIHVKLFYKGSPLPFPDWFRKTLDSKLASN